MSRESRTFPGYSDPGARVAILLSIIGPITWVVLTLLYVGFWASGFTLFQSVIVVLVSLVLLGGVLGTAWYLYGSRHPWVFEPGA